MTTKLLNAGEVYRLHSPWQISTHSHAHTELICFQAGRGSVVVGNQIFAPQTGSVLIYRPTIAHEEKADPVTGQHTCWLAVRGTALRDTPTHLHDTTGEIRWLFTALLREKMRASVNTALATAYLTALLQLLHRETSLNEIHWAERLQEYINQHFREPDLTLEKLSVAVGISTSAITHEFHHYSGEPVSRYILNLRLSEARALLRQTKWPIKVIAAHVGFNDPYYFSTKFQRECKLSPGAYRRGVR